MNINLFSTYFIVAIVQITKSNRKTIDDPLVGTEYSLTDILNISNICSKILVDSFDYNLFPGLGNDLIILFQIQKKDYGNKKLMNILEYCAKEILKSLGMEVFITIGSLESDYQSASKSYKSAIELIDYSFIMPSCSIADYTVITNASRDRNSIIDIDFEAIRNYTLNKNIDSLLMYFDEIKKKLDMPGSITPNQLRNLFIEIAYNIINVSSSTNKSNSKHIALIDEIFKKVYQMKSISDLMHWIRSVSVKIIDGLISAEKNRNPLIKRILNHIENNYSQDLSLKTISALFKANTIYLGQLFKNETGELFSNYLNKKRIDKAKEMILTKKLTAGEIGLKVGYSSRNYFYSIFKKYTGVYPQDFKSSNK